MTELPANRKVARFTSYPSNELTLPQSVMILFAQLTATRVVY
jgi:hypothetical protein